MAVLFKFNHVNFEKKWSGTFWYGFPVLAKCGCLQCCNAWTVDLRPWNTNRHQARQTEDTFTRSSGSRYCNTSGQKKSRTSVIFTMLVCALKAKECVEIDAYVIEISHAGFWFRFATNSHLLIEGILCSVSDRLQLSLFFLKDCGELIVVNQVFQSFFRVNTSFNHTKWITGKLSKLTLRRLWYFLLECIEIFEIQLFITFYFQKEIGWTMCKWTFRVGSGSKCVKSDTSVSTIRLFSRRQYTSSDLFR